MGPFNAGLPQISLPSSIGSGLGFLNKTLSAKLFGPGQHAGGAAELLEFLRGFKHAGESLLLSSRVDSVNRLRAALLRAGEFSCVLGRPVESENILETDQPTDHSLSTDPK